MSLVSVCIPTYEPNPVHLREAIESVLRQTEADWELIIHDDASPSNVENIVRPFLGDSRIRFGRSPKRLGIGGNWNACMRMARAPFVAFLFQDDLWEARYLERCLQIFKHEQDVGFVAANHHYRIEGKTAASGTGIYEEVEDLRKSAMPEGRMERRKFLEAWLDRGLRPNLIGEPSFVMLRRALVDSVGTFREDMKQGLDSEYWIRCLLQSDGWWLAETFGTFRVHARGATAMNEASGAGSMDRLRVFRSLIRHLPPGHMRTAAKRKMRAELLGMAKKFVQRRILRSN